ncbi:MAG: excinuclease ABC subunit UvrC [Spirochaetes bacterium]|nr:excinuclease ABC subunit UvrC [Spirochaetota bacterium]
MLNDKIAALPDLPGVYFMKDNGGGIIYIGKAKSLRKRVSSYFSNSAKDPKTTLLVANIADIEILVTKSETEALILEAELIKKHTPYYNIDLKDNKSFPFIKITDEPFPRIYKTRTVTPDGRYFGPFVNVHYIYDILKVIGRMYPLRMCRHKQFPRKVPCLNYHIHRCKAPCSGRISVEEYRGYIDEVTLILEGHSEELEKILDAKMKVLAADMKYEQARTLRDQIAALRSLRVPQDVYSLDGDSADVLGIYGEGVTHTIIVLSVQNGRLIDKRSYSATGVGGYVSLIEEFIKRRYEGIKAPPIIRVAEDIEDREAMSAWLSDKSGSPVSIQYTPGTTKTGLLAIAYENALLTFKETHLTAYADEGTARLKEIFHFDKSPVAIDAFDIAHLSGDVTMAAAIRLKNGVDDKEQYRLFKIRTVEGINDPASIREAVFRRYKHIRDEQLPMPDLTLIDGGRTQLDAAIDALKELGIRGHKIISLAKQFEEIYLPNRDEPIRLPANDAGLRLLQRARDEVHRFVNSRHRTARIKKELLSVLEKIDGVGPATRIRLLKHFQSIEAIRAATEEELHGVPGISAVAAHRIRGYFDTKK